MQLIFESLQEVLDFVKQLKTEKPKIRIPPEAQHCEQEFRAFKSRLEEKNDEFNI